MYLIYNNFHYDFQDCSLAEAKKAARKASIADRAVSIVYERISETHSCEVYRFAYAAKNGKIYHKYDYFAKYYTYDYLHT